MAAAFCWRRVQHIVLTNNYRTYALHVSCTYAWQKKITSSIQKPTYALQEHEFSASISLLPHLKVLERGYGRAEALLNDIWKQDKQQLLQQKFAKDVSGITPGMSSHSTASSGRPSISWDFQRRSIRRILCRPRSCLVYIRKALERLSLLLRGTKFTILIFNEPINRAMGKKKRGFKKYIRIIGHFLPSFFPKMREPGRKTRVWMLRDWGKHRSNSSN